MSLKLNNTEQSIRRRLTQAGIDEQARILIACSGGQDSVILVHILKKLGINIAIAHCNFQLRGEESEGDQAFVEELACNLGIPVFTRRFDVPAYGMEHQLSTQMAARDLRYQWFEELLDEKEYAYLATAHHQEDSLETQLLNFSKGSIISGLTGIAFQNGRVLRPFYQTPKETIAQYAATFKLQWREDSSNASEDYQRNLLRLSVIPKLRQINPSLGKTLQRSGEIRAYLTEFIYDQIASDQQLMQEMISDKRLSPWNQFTSLQNNPAIVYLHLEPLGFSYDQACHILDARISNESRRFIASEHEIFASAKGLQIIKTSTSPPLNEILIPGPRISPAMRDCTISLEELDEYIQPERSQKHIIWAAAEKVRFPLKLRVKREGDYFRPLGMGGKKKRISLYLKDSKIPISERREVWVLEDASGEIIWLVNYHPSESIRIDNSGKRLIRIIINGLDKPTQA